MKLEKGTIFMESTSFIWYGIYLLIMHSAQSVIDWA